MESLLQETRSFSLIHVQQVVDVLCSLFHYSLAIAPKQCVLRLARCLPGSREYFDVLENALYMVEESVGALVRTEA